jgi:hypothetical protein
MERVKMPTTDKWIKKMYLYSMESYSARKNETLLFAVKWAELKNIILSEVSQAQKAKHHVFSHRKKYYIHIEIHTECIQNWAGRDQGMRKRRKEDSKQ